MRVILLFILIVFGVVSCSSSSNKKIDREVSSEAQSIVPITDPVEQYESAVAEVEHSKVFSPDQKERLIQLIDAYALESSKLRRKQSQYRSVLLKEMLESSEKINKKANVAREKLKEINIEGANNFEKFVKDFKFITGEEVRNQRGLMLQVIDV